MFDDEDCYCIYQFSLKCNKNDIRYSELLQAVNFINATKAIIMFIYDDRGCEVIAKNKETIRPFYEKYKKWISCYDCQKIDSYFI